MNKQDVQISKYMQKAHSITYEPLSWQKDMLRWVVLEYRQFPFQAAMGKRNKAGG